MSDKHRARRIKLFVSWFTVVAMIALGYALRDQIAEAFDNLGRVNYFWLFLMPIFQGINYFAQAKLYQGIFRILGERFRTKSMYRLSLELNFVNTVIPSGGVSGFSYLGLRMRDEHISGAKSTIIQMMRFILYFISFQILLAVGLIFLAVDGSANGLVILAAGSLATLLAVGTALLAYVIGSKQRINAFFTILTKIINRVIHFFRRNNPETISIAKTQAAFTELHENYMHIKRNLSGLKRPLGYALLANVTEILTIYVVYLAFGSLVNPGAIIIAYAIANFAGLISVLPGGVGIYEALMTAVLVSAGIPASVSLPVTVMYRVLNMAIQLPPGGFLYYRALHQDAIKPIKH